LKRAILATVAALSMTTAAFSQNQQRSKSADIPAGDKAFVLKAAQGGKAEVELGKLAAMRAQSADVKQFAQRMIDDHGKAGEELKAIAQSKMIAVPDHLDAKAQALHDRLSTLSGDAFDRGYMQAMVTDHRQAAAAFRRESTIGKDSEIKAFAARTLPAIEEHLKMAIAASQKTAATAGANRSAPAPR
jgi:putative membrane protein